MSQTNTPSPSGAWTSTQAYTLSVACLAIGIAGGWFVRGSQSPATAMASAANTSAPAAAQPSPEQMRHMADKQAEPLLSQLKSDQSNPTLLASVGNVYYDAQQFPTAIDYYQHSLQAKPEDASVRTDMATAYWYLGNADTAIVEFNRALAYEPNKPNALFNLGIVQWQGKMNVEAALSAWQKLLDTNPNYENKAKLLELMAQVRKHVDIKPGTQAKATTE
jgi:tetratricopeptide (TPR) repeat protein